ncbi:MAG: TolC family protein [Croceitalea sp.]|nr:TolC family protein [Croceitalea sp.]MBT8238164.1 TolC family protein [Croceitalea sp.]NNC33626.1 TolC family protein [Croceitalea sp.]NNL09396.1 TolC family protein [Croceitalea sp.]NNM17462.1 TolC family protein [Croceitalea sp.]
MGNRLLLALAVTLIANVSFAQSINEFVTKGLAENDISKKLPPLDSLIAIANDNSPRLKFFDADYEYWNGTVKLAKKAWLNNINLDAGYGYGIFDNLSSQQLAGDPMSQALFSSEQSRYTVGASIKLPLSSIFNRGREVKNAKAEAEKSKYQKDFAIWELEQLIVRQYNDLIKAHRLFFISNSIVETYKVQSVRAEKDFANGAINVTEYTRLQQMLNQAISAFESQRAEFLIALKSLEGTVGIEIQF